MEYVDPDVAQRIYGQAAQGKTDGPSLTNGGRKALMRRKGKAVQFDQNAKRDFVLGFHKRKLERRANAQKKAQAMEREERIKRRSQIREEKRQTIGNIKPPMNLAEYTVEELKAMIEVAKLREKREAEKEAEFARKEEERRIHESKEEEADNEAHRGHHHHVHRHSKKEEEEIDEEAERREVKRFRAQRKEERRRARRADSW